VSALRLGILRVWFLLFFLLPFAAARGGPITQSSIAFEENRGQAPPGVAFLSRAGASFILLVRDGAMIGGLQIQLAGVKPGKPSGLHLLPARSNYFRGSDPAQWRTAVPNYREVRYPHIYPGIDLLWHAHGEDIEHDFLLAPGANPRSIGLLIHGESPRIDAKGDLVAGLYQVNVQIPADIQSGTQDLQISAGGLNSNTVAVTVQ